MIDQDPVHSGQQWSRSGARVKSFLKMSTRDGEQTAMTQIWFPLFLPQSMCRSSHWGAGQFSHLSPGLPTGASAVASGSAFVFIGRLRAVLITYPSAQEVKRSLGTTVRILVQTLVPIISGVLILCDGQQRSGRHLWR